MNKILRLFGLALIVTLLTIAPALAQDGGASFNPQDLLRNALEWVVPVHFETTY